MNIFDVLNQPSMLHSAAVHMPIALAMLNLLLIIATAIFERSSALRYVTLAAHVLLLASVQYGITTGDAARELVPNTLTQEVWDVLDHHEAMALRVRLASVFTLVFVALVLIPHAEWRKGMLLVAGVGAFITILLVSTTAHYGGHLVYAYGVGTPVMHQPEQTAAVPPVESTPGEAPADPAEVVDPLSGTTPEPAAEEELVPVREIDMEQAKTVDFQRDVWPIIDFACADCHKPEKLDGGLDLTTIENMMKAGEKAGPAVIPGDPDASAMIQYIRGELKPRMPHKEPPMNPDDLHMLRMWIAAGATPEAAVEAAPGEVPGQEGVFDPFGG